MEKTKKLNDLLGWILCADEDLADDIAEKKLRDLGVELLRKRNPHEWEVRVTPAVFTKLEPQWGEFIWGLA